MSYCPNCGSELPREDVKFCPYCGHKQPVASYSNTDFKPLQTTQKPPTTNASTNKPKKKNNGSTIFALLGLLVCVVITISLAATIAVFAFGMSGDIQDSPAYSSSSSLTPQEIFGIYFYGFNNVNEDAIWGVLSTGAQADDSKSFIYNTIYALNSQGMRYIEYSITDFQIDGDTGQMFVTVEFDANGYRLSRDKEIPFVRENGVWKIDNFVRLP